MSKPIQNGPSGSWRGVRSRPAIVPRIMHSVTLRPPICPDIDTSTFASGRPSKRPRILNDWNRSPYTRHVSCAADHFHRCTDSHDRKKFGCKVPGHSNTTVRCRVARQITPMHPDASAEFHKVRHRSGDIVTSRRDVRAWRRVWIDYPAIRIADKTKVCGLVACVFANDPEGSGRGFPTGFTRGNRCDQSDPVILDQVSGLLGQVNDYRCLLSANFRSQPNCQQRKY